MNERMTKWQNDKTTKNVNVHVSKLTLAAREKSKLQIQLINYIYKV